MSEWERWRRGVLVILDRMDSHLSQLQREIARDVVTVSTADASASDDTVAIAVIAWETDTT